MHSVYKGHVSTTDPYCQMQWSRKVVGGGCKSITNEHNRSIGEKQCSSQVVGGCIEIGFIFDKRTLSDS